jgi:hypothetical protein
MSRHDLQVLIASQVLVNWSNRRTVPLDRINAANAWSEAGHILNSLGVGEKGTCSIGELGPQSPGEIYYLTS